MNPLKSQKGNVILLALGMAALVASIVLEIKRRNEVTLGRSQQAVVRDIADSLEASIRARLQNPESCTALLRGQRLTPGARPSVTPAQNLVSLPYRFDPGTPSAQLTTGQEATTGIYLQMLGIDASRPMDMVTQIAGAAGAVVFERYPVSLHVVYGGATAAQNRQTVINRAAIVDSSGTEIRDLGIPFFVWVSGGVIDSCFGENSAGSICNDLGGYFQPAFRPYNFSCRQSIYTERVVQGPPPTQTNIGSCRVARIIQMGTRSTAGQARTQCRNYIPNPMRLYAVQLMDNYSYTRPLINFDKWLCLQCD
jgi:hypothetical protein